MGNITIISDLLPKRCEICHQSDCFDSNTNECTRCAFSKNAAKELSPRKINVLVELNLKDVLGLPNGSIFSTLANLIGVYGILMGSWYLLFSLISGKFIDGAFGFYIFLPILIYLIALSFILGFTKYKNFKNQEKNVRYCFEENSYEVSTQKTFTHVNWDSLKKVKETSTDFFFIQNYTMINSVPKRFFNSMEEIEQLRNIIKTKLGSKAKLFSKKTSFFYHPATSLIVFLIGVLCLSFLGIISHKISKKEDLYRQTSELLWGGQTSQENDHKAENILLVLEKEYPNDVEVLHRLAHYLIYKKESYVSAEKYLLKILNNSNKCENYQLASTNELLGICRFEQKDLDGAEKYFLASLAIYPDSTPSRYLGDIALKRKDYKEAEKYYLKAIAFTPSGVNTRFALAQLYESTNRITEAIAQYELIENLAKENNLEAANKATEKKLKLKNVTQN